MPLLFSRLAFLISFQKKNPHAPRSFHPPKSPCIVTFRPQRTNLQSRFRERPIVNDDIYHSHPPIHSPTPTAPLFTPPKNQPPTLSRHSPTRSPAQHTPICSDSTTPSRPPSYFAHLTSSPGPLNALSNSSPPSTRPTNLILYQKRYLMTDTIFFCGKEKGFFSVQGMWWGSGGGKGY